MRRALNIRDILLLIALVGLAIGLVLTTTQAYAYYGGRYYGGRPRTFLRRMWEIPQSIPILRGTMAPMHCYPQTGGSFR